MSVFKGNIAMLFQFSEEERLIQKTVRDFARKELAAVADISNRDGVFRDDIIEGLSALGLMGITVPEEYGGVNFGTFCLAVALEEISRVCPSTAVAVSVHNSLANHIVLKYGSAELKAKYLPRMASGEAIGVYALTEPDAGSDVSAIRMSAVRQGAGIYTQWIKDLHIDGRQGGRGDRHREDRSREQDEGAHRLSRRTGLPRLFDRQGRAQDGPEGFDDRGAGLRGLQGAGLAMFSAKRGWGCR